MTEQIAVLDTWDAYPRIPGHEFGAMFPLAQLGPRLWEHRACENVPAFFDSAEPFELLIVSGSIRVHGDQLAALTGGARTLLVVDGDLHVDGVATGIYHVSGDLHCHAIFLETLMSRAVGGRIVARDCAWANSTSVDHHGSYDIDPAPALTLETPFLFTFCVEIDNLVLVGQPLILDQGCEDERTLYCLASRFQVRLFHRISDHPFCDAERIIAALRAGEPILRDGYDPAAEPWVALAHEEWRKDDHRAAYLNFKKASMIAPGFYHAWKGMADVLSEMGAYRQALPAYVSASRLFPEAQTHLINDAADQGARCAIRCGEFATAIELATRSIEQNRPCRSSRDRFEEAYRLRAEAYLLGGDGRNAAAALADLDQYLSTFPTSGAGLWLKGLAHWHGGEHALAAACLAQAVEQSDSWAVAYEQGGYTLFLGCEEEVVDWDTVCLDEYVLPARDQAYWDDYVRNMDPDLQEFCTVPEQFRTSAMCEALLEWSDYFIHFFALVPPHAYTPNIAEKAARSEFPGFACIPSRLINKSLCLMVTKQRCGFPLHHVPAHVIDREICEHALRCGTSLDYLPVAYRDREMYMLAVTEGGHSIEELPLAWRDDDMIALAIAHGKPRCSERHEADYMRAPYYLSLAIERHKKALDAITGNLFDEALYQQAYRLYGQDADWPDIVARHNETFIERNRGECYAEVCWSVFWTEATLLRLIRKKPGGICPCYIPAERFSEAVARVCARAEPRYLSSIPARWIDAAICESVSRQRPEQIEFMPLALRSAAICARAMKADPASFGLVPLARRSVKLCIAALRANPQRSEQIPARRRRQVFDTLIKKYAGEFDIDWLHRERARVAGDPDEAPDTDMLPASELLDAAECLSAGGDHERGLLRLRAAADLLTGAGCERADLWARLLDLERIALSGLGRPERSAQVCRDLIERFGQLTLFRGDHACNPMRVALRACYLQLATRPMGDEATISDLEANLALLDKGMAIAFGPYEGEWLLSDFFKARAGLLKRMAGMAPSWQGAYEASLEALRVSQED